MDMDILFRIGGLAIGILLAFTGISFFTRGKRKAARARRETLNRTAADYWRRPAKIRRSRSKAA
jgi:hypothetical protein